MSLPELRPARVADVPALNVLIEQSARALSNGFYSAEEVDAAIRFVFGVDTSLIDDGTYFVAEVDGQVAGCGGWSMRRTLYGGDQRRIGGTDQLDPRVDAARIRAFFVAPEFARRGIGRQILRASALAAERAGFLQLELMSTLPGVPLYHSCGFTSVEPVADTMPNGVPVRFVRMRASVVDVLERSG